MIKPFKEFVTEKIELSKYRELYREIGEEYKTRYEDWFGTTANGKPIWRIYLPLSGAVADPLYQQINNALARNDYEIKDWNNGLAKSKKSNREQRIGRLLTSLKEEELLKKFNERHKGREVAKEDEEDLLVVISRHPYDIAGMSYDRLRYGFKNKDGEWLSKEEFITKYKNDEGIDFKSWNDIKTDDGQTWKQSNLGWTSCKHLVDGQNNHYIPSEIDDGCLVAYVIRKDDKNIQEPISRLLIVPLYNQNDKDDTILYVGDKFYGKSISKFKQVVEDWLIDHQGETDIYDYCLDTDRIYNDDYNELNTTNIEYLREVLENHDFYDIDIDINGCQAKTRNMDLLDDMILSYKEKRQTPSRISDIFNYDSNYSYVDWEKWLYQDEIQNYLKDDADDDIKELIYKAYKAKGGELDYEDDWDDIVEELDDYLASELTDDISKWYTGQREEEDIKGLQYTIQRTINNAQDVFNVRKSDGDWIIEVDANQNDFDFLSGVLEGGVEMNEYFGFELDRIWDDALNNTDGVEMSELDYEIDNLLSKYKD